MGQNGGMIGILILIVFVVFYMIITIKKQQKSMMEMETKLGQLKPGDKVKTYNGFYGTITKIYDTTDGKVFTLNISQNQNECLVDVNVRNIAGVDTKQVIEYDKDMNVISLDGVPVEEALKNSESESADNQTKIDGQNANDSNE